MGPNGSGKSTLAHVLMGKPGYQVLGGSVTLDGEDLLALPAWRRARLGLFLAPQYPTEIPGVRPAGDAGRGPGRPARPRTPTTPDRRVGSATDRAAAEAERVGLETQLLDRPAQRRSVGRRAQAQRDPAAGRPAAAHRRARRARLGPRRRRAARRGPPGPRRRWTNGGSASWPSPTTAGCSSVLRPDVVHVLVRRAHRGQRRPRAGRGARAHGLRAPRRDAADADRHADGFTDRPD